MQSPETGVAAYVASHVSLLVRLLCDLISLSKYTDPNSLAKTRSPGSLTTVCQQVAPSEITQMLDRPDLSETFRVFLMRCLPGSYIGNMVDGPGRGQYEQERPISTSGIGPEFEIC